MFEIENLIISESKSSFNWVALIALLVSVASIFVSFYNLYLSKRIEIINTKFQKLCITAIDDLFKSYDEQFQEGFISLSDARRISTTVYVDVQLYITALKSIYLSIDINKIIRECEDFTDKLYKSEDFDIIEIKSQYLISKLHIYQLLYEFGLKNELSLLKRLGLKK